MTDHRDAMFEVPEAQPFDFAGGEHGVLLIHGFTGSPGHMRLLGEHLRDRGFTVKGICLPGHAVTMQAMAEVTWRDWLNAAVEGFEALKKQCRYVSVAGLSMGGCLSLILAEEHPLTAVAPISAPMAVQNRMMPFARLAAPFIKTITWGSDPDRPSMLDSRYDLGYTGFPTKSAADLSRLIRHARRNLGRITCPILAVQSHADETIAPESADVIIGGVSSADKHLLWLDKVPHVCTISEEHEHIAAEVGGLFKQAEKG